MAVVRPIAIKILFIAAATLMKICTMLDTVTQLVIALVDQTYSARDGAELTTVDY